MHKVEIPRENANDDNVTITSINVKNYQEVKKGDILFEFETSKAVIEVESEKDGIVSLNVEVGQIVPVGWIAAIIDDKFVNFDKKKDNFEENFENLEKFSSKAIDLIKKHNIDKKEFLNLDFVTAEDVEKIITQKLSNESEKLPDKINEDDIALFGAGFQCQVVLDMVATEKLNINIIAIIDSNPKKNKLDNINVLYKHSLDLLFEKGLRKIHICIGDGKIKSELANEFISKGFEIVSLIAPSAVISQSAKLEEGVFIGSGVYIGREVRINKLCQINHQVSIAHHCIVGSGSFFADGCRIGGGVSFGDNVSLGIGVIINRDINVGSNSSVPSGAIIIKNLTKGENYKNRKTTK